MPVVCCFWLHEINLIALYVLRFMRIPVRYGHKLYRRYRARIRVFCFFFFPEKREDHPVICLMRIPALSHVSTFSFIARQARRLMQTVHSAASLRHEELNSSKLHTGSSPRSSTRADSAVAVGACERKDRDAAMERTKTVSVMLHPAEDASPLDSDTR